MRQVLLAAWMCATACPIVPAMGQEGATPATPTASERRGDDGARVNHAKPIRFNFKDAPIAQVLEFYSRETGLPMIAQAEVPKAQMTFISPESYSFDEAMTIINRFLNMHKAQLRHEGGYLYLSSIQEAARQAGRTFPGEVPPDVPPDEIITLTIPLLNARADVVATHLKSMVADYGSVVPMEAQNSIIVTETAAQCRRIVGIVRVIDRDLVDQHVQLFPLVHAKADDVGKALTALVRVRERQVIIDRQSGARQNVQDVNIEGLNFYPDARTNSILAVGPRARVEMIGNLIAMLDVPGQGASDRRMMMFSLESITPDEASRHVTALYQGLPGPQRPTVVALPSAGKLAVIGAAELLAQATMLMAEIDPAGGDENIAAGRDRVARVLALEYLTADGAQSIVSRLLTPRQSRVLIIAPAPDGRGLVVVGPPGDVEALSEMVSAMDRPREVEREVRQIRVSRDAAVVTARAKELYEKASIAEREPVSASVEAGAPGEPGLVTLIGGREGLARFEAILRSVETSAVVETQVRTFTLAHARPPEMIARLPRIARMMLVPADGSRFVEPVYEAIDDLDQIIVRAEPMHFAVIEELVRRLDEPTAGVEVRAYRVIHADLGAVSRALSELASRGALAPGARVPVTISTEPSTRSLVVSGPTEAFAGVESLLAELDAAPRRPATSMKMFTLSHARAERIQPLLQQLLTTRVREQQHREGGQPDVQSLLEVAADPTSNTLIISAPEGIMPIAEELIKAMDTEASARGRSVLRVAPLLFADATQVAGSVSQAIPHMELPNGGPVSVLAAAASNALVLTGTPRDLEKVEELVKQLDLRPEDPETLAVETFALKFAEATNIAQTVQRLLTDQQETDPQILRLQLQYGRNRPELFRKPTIRVEADGRTNSLVVSAPSATLELARTIITRLDQPADRSEVTAATFSPAKADPHALSGTVSRIVNATVEQGRRPCELTVEPRSASIVVVGTEAQVTEAVRLLGEFDDRAVAAPAMDVTLIELTHADAGAVAGTVQGLLGDRSRWPDDLRRAERAGLGIPSPTARAEAGTNRLIISAPTVLMPVAREMVAVFDRQSESGASVDVRVIRMSRGNAGATANAVRAALEGSARPGERRPTVAAEPASNSIVVSGSSERIAQAEALVREMDASIEPSGIGVRTLFLRHARAEAVAPIIEGVLKKGSALEFLPNWAVPGYLQQTGEDPRGNVRVAAERRLNAVVVSAPLPILELAEQIVAELDAEAHAERGEARRVVRVISLTNADASDLAGNIQAVFADDDSNEPPPTVRVDRGSNSMVVRATAGQMKVIEDLAKEIDDATLTTSRQMRMIPVDRSRVDAAVMAETLRRLLEQRRGVKVEVISVEDLLKPERQGSDLRWERGGELEVEAAAAGVAPVTEPTGGARKTRGSPVAEPTGGTMVDAVRAAVGMVALSAQPGGKASDDVVIAVDPVTNSLMIVGSPRMTEHVAALAVELERQMPTEPSRVRVVTLPDGVDARVVGQVVDQTVRQLGRTSAANPGGLTGAVATMVDPGGGALIVWANDSDFTTIGELIASISRLEASASLTVKMYPLSMVSASNAARAIEDLLGAQPRGRQATRFLRSLDMTLLQIEGEAIRTRIDPAQVRVFADPNDASLIVAGPADALPMIDAFIAMIDQSPVTDRLAIRRYPLTNAKAADLSRTLQSLFDAQRQGAGRRAGDLPQARFLADDRTNSLLVTGAEAQHQEVQRLLAEADAPAEDDGLALSIIALQNAAPITVKRIVDEILVGRDPGKAERIRVSAEPDSNLLVVRADEATTQEIRRIVAEVDTTAVTGLPVRTLKLQRADAQAVATALARFFDERARATTRRGQPSVRGVTIVGDRRTGTLVIAASDEEFAQIEGMVGTFDAPAPSKDLKWEIIQLKHTRAADLSRIVEDLSWMLQSERLWGTRAADAPPDDKIFITTHEANNMVLVMGQGETLEVIRNIVADLDRPMSEVTRKIVRAVPIERADMRAIANVIRTAFSEQDRSIWWMARTVQRVTVEIDEVRRVMILIGEQAHVDEAEAYVKQLADASAQPNQRIETVPLRHADASRTAGSLRTFFQDRARQQGLPSTAVTIIGSQDGNVLIVSADEQGMGLLKDLVAQMDKPEVGEHRRIEVYALRHRDPQETAGILRAQFPASARAEDRVLITPQPSTGSLIISARPEDFAQITALLEQLDSSPDTGGIVTISLKTARAAEVAQALASALPAGLKVKITPVARSNSIMLTGSDEAIALVKEQIRTLDEEKVQALVEFRQVRLRHAVASEVYGTLTQMLRARRRVPGEVEPSIDYTLSSNAISVNAPADEIEGILRMIEQLDVPADATQRTEFVKLQFAPADQVAKALEFFYGRFARAPKTAGSRAVSIVPDPVTNSLLISAGEAEWTDIMALLKQFDSDEYDTERQLLLIPLVHADAQSVARALNEGLRAPMEARLNRERMQIEARQRALQRLGGRDALLLDDSGSFIEGEDVPTVSAEVQTNSLIVFAGRKQLDRIERIVQQLDRPDIARFADAKVIPLSAGRASRVAEAIRAVMVQRPGRAGSRAAMIYGDDASNSLVVRADEADMAEILALAEQLQHREDAMPEVRVLRLHNVPAARLQSTIQTAFARTATELGETFSVQVDRGTNALVVASSQRLYDQIRKVVAELDGVLVMPGEGQQGVPPGLAPGVFIIDVKHNSPEQVRQMLEQMGVTRQPPADRQGVVSEPVTIIPLTSRQALAVIASPQDGPVVVGLVRALDAEPMAAEQHVSMIALRRNAAQDVVTALRSMIGGAGQASEAAPAKAVAEQLRRINFMRAGVGQADLALDLSVPIRLLGDNATNSVLVASSRANVVAISEIIASLDTLAIGDAVVVRIFPLENAQAVRAKRVIDELFQQGEALRRLPGTQRRGVPTTATGQALAGEIAVSIDDRTNTLFVAGREEAVALVELLIGQLDSQEAAGWVEPAIIALKHADATRLSATLRTLLTDSQRLPPDSAGLRTQVARLRLLQSGKDPTDPEARIEADLFTALSNVVITPEPQLNALIVVASQANLALVRELVTSLDVELASAANSVRFYPLKHAAADRVGQVVSGVFREREQVGAARPEDRLIVQADARTNTLVVSTSPSSFAILDGIIARLDAEESQAMVGIHVLPVGTQDARRLAPKILTLMRERIESGLRSGAVRSSLDTFSIEAEPTNNVLIVVASNENLQVVKDLLEALTTGVATAPGAERTELITVTSATATEAAQTVRQLYSDKENERRGANAVVVVPNDRLSSLIVTGTDADIAAVTDIVRRLDTAKVAKVREIRPYALQSANALEVVNLLEAVLAGQPISRTRGLGMQQATRLRYFRERVVKEVQEGMGPDPSEAEVDGAVRELVTLTPDPRTNTIFVGAPADVMGLILDIIEDLDSSRRGEREVAEFQLKNADAAAMARLLRDLFNLQEQGGRLVLVPTRQDETPQEDVPGTIPGMRLTPIPDERQQLAITIDARTNTLLVSGTTEYIKDVRRIVEHLDSIEATEREGFIYRLRNAQADEVERTLQTYFQREAERFRQTLRPELLGSFTSQLEREVTVVGDLKSNTVLVSASPRNVDLVRQMVKELDAAPPQVLIQVLLAEVTLDSSDNWGVDLRVKEFGGDMYTFGALAAGAGVASALGVPNLTFASTDFELILRALQAKGKLEVLSRPQVTVTNNETANFQAGENIALVSSTERTTDGRTVANIERRDVGIILDVTPSISSDGFVRLRVEPEISAVSAQKTQITEDFQADRLTQRKLATVVRVRDGQTVVLGGLIQTQQEERRTKVPFVGDIPVIGQIFRSKNISNVKTELLVILTPRVIPGEEGEAIELLDKYSIHEIHRMTPADKILEDLRRSDPRNFEIEAPPTEGPAADGDSTSPAPKEPTKP